MSDLRCTIAIVTTEWGWSVPCINKQHRWGQWVNAFSMAMRLALGRDEVERLTQGSKSQVTPEHYCRPSPNSAGDPEEKPLQPTHHPACSWEHQLWRVATERRRAGEVDGAQLTGCVPVPRHSFTPIPLSVFVINHTTHFLFSFRAISPKTCFNILMSSYIAAINYAFKWL